MEVDNSKHLFGLANDRAKFEAKRRGMSMVVGSDSHFADTVGLGVTEIMPRMWLEFWRLYELGGPRSWGTPLKLFREILLPISTCRFEECQKSLE